MTPGYLALELYTHVAAASRQDGANNAPISIVFNPYARPGWTTYPLGTLANGFQPLYDELAKHGDPAWGSVEANNVAFTNPNAPGWERYLAWHYNHGAKLVLINVGAADQSIMANLTKGAFGDEAVAAYRKFLRGEKLTEAPASNTAAMPPVDLQEKVHKVQAALPLWLQEHGPAQVQDNATKLSQSLDEQRFGDAMAAAEALLKTMGK